MTGGGARSENGLTVRIVGPGRAGGSFGLALAEVGWTTLEPLGRSDDLHAAAAGADVVIIATPDAVIAETAAAVEPVATTAVVHLAGSLGLEVLAGHVRRAALHPLTSMPDATIGARRLRAGAWFAVAGDPMARRIVADLQGQAFEVADGDRAAYHAAAVIASNHVVALLGQAERVAAAVGVPFAVYLDLVRATIDNVADLGPRAALTGPAARGDQDTLDRHLTAIDPSEHEAYVTMAQLAARLAAGA